MNLDELQLKSLPAFLGVGVIATAVQYVTLVIAVERFAVNSVVGSVAGYLLGAVLNYLLNYYLTFRSGNAHGVAVRRFAIVAAVGLALNAAMMALLAQGLKLPYLLAQIATTGAVLIWNFLGNSLWSFAGRRNPPAQGVIGGPK
jgi:putative flippase GtrA